MRGEYPCARGLVFCLGDDKFVLKRRLGLGLREHLCPRG